MANTDIWIIESRHYIMTNITTYQQLRANVQQINLIKATNHMLLSKFVSSDEFLDLLNETRLSAEPVETYVIDNTVQIKYNYKTIGFKVILTDKEIVDFKIETILKDKVSTKIEEVDYMLNDIENTAKLIMERFDNDKPIVMNYVEYWYIRYTLFYIFLFDFLILFIYNIQDIKLVGDKLRISENLKDVDLFNLE